MGTQEVNTHTGPNGATVAPKVSEQSLEQEIARLRAENEKLRMAKFSKVSFKVSEKGALSVYGLGRWPVTLYKSQWEALLARTDEIKAFIHDNHGRLAEKAD